MDKMKELYEKVAKDGNLQAKFNAIMKEAGDSKFAEKLSSFAKEAGYEVSIEEAQKFFKTLSEEKEGQLSDSELDMVAGGKNLPFIAHSVATMGIGCASQSIVGAIEKKACGDV
jgi:predicted ribosomally synthesized peptide with nif11-like leader